MKLIKPNANALLWKITSLARIVCVCYISMPSCTSSVRSSGTHQRSCERKASVFADTSLYLRETELFSSTYICIRQEDWWETANLQMFCCMLMQAISLALSLLTLELLVIIIISTYSETSGRRVDFLVFTVLLLLHASYTAGQMFGIITKKSFVCVSERSLFYGRPFPPLNKKCKKVIATFYLTNLTFLLIIEWYKLAILTLFLKIMSLYLAILRTYQVCWSMFSNC